MNKKVFICAGGTGGHLFPAVALAHDLVQRNPSLQLLFVGGGLAANRYFDQSSLAFREIACGSVATKKPWELLKGAFGITKGIVQSYDLLRREKPDVMVGFGSFYGFPPLVAAATMGIPLVLYAADAIPGRVVRYMANKACMTGLHLGSAASYLDGPSITVGMPIRPQLLDERTDAATARRFYGLDPDAMTLLVFGGSQGAQAINQLMQHAVNLLSPQLKEPLQVIHLTGREEGTEELRRAYQNQGIQSCVKAYETHMGLAWSAANVAVCRSGASTLAELRAFAVPSILIPYPYAMDNHQDKNADVAVSLGCALKAQQQTLNSQLLAALLARLVNNHENCLTSMKEALQRGQLETPQKSLTDVVLDTLTHENL